MQNLSAKNLVQLCKQGMAVILILSLAVSSWADLDTIIIDQGVDDPIRIAVVPFALSEDLDSADNLDKLIRFDLARSGQFDPVAPENMLSYPSTQDAVFFLSLIHI